LPLQVRLPQMHPRIRHPNRAQRASWSVEHSGADLRFGVPNRVAAVPLALVQEPADARRRSDRHQ
jgi:hypothetical protein